MVVRIAEPYFPFLRRSHVHVPCRPMHCPLQLQPSLSQLRQAYPACPSLSHVLPTILVAVILPLGLAFTLSLPHRQPSSSLTSNINQHIHRRPQFSRASVVLSPRSLPHIRSIPEVLADSVHSLSVCPVALGTCPLQQLLLFSPKSLQQAFGTFL